MSSRLPPIKEGHLQSDALLSAKNRRRIPAAGGPVEEEEEEEEDDAERAALIRQLEGLSVMPRMAPPSSLTSMLDAAGLAALDPSRRMGPSNLPLLPPAPESQRPNAGRARDEAEYLSMLPPYRVMERESTRYPGVMRREVIFPEPRVPEGHQFTLPEPAAARGPAARATINTAPMLPPIRAPLSDPRYPPGPPQPGSPTPLVRRSGPTLPAIGRGKKGAKPRGMRWIDALRHWNAHHKAVNTAHVWMTPRKGTAEHAEVKAIMNYHKPDAVAARNEARRVTSIEQLKKATAHMKPGVRKDPAPPRSNLERLNDTYSFPMGEEMGGINGADGVGGFIEEVIERFKVAYTKISLASRKRLAKEVLQNLFPTATSFSSLAVSVLAEPSQKDGGVEMSLSKGKVKAKLIYSEVSDADRRYLKAATKAALAKFR